MADLLCLKWNNHSSTLLKKLKAIYSKDIFCDATIACQGRFYPVHKLVLSVCSEYFEEIFKQTQCKHPFLILKDANPSELEALLSFMYNGEVNVPKEELPGLIKAAESLKIKGLAVSDDYQEEYFDKPSKKRKLKHSSRGYQESQESQESCANSSHAEKEFSSTNNSISHEQDKNEITIKTENVDSNLVPEEGAADDNLVSEYDGYERASSVEPCSLSSLQHSSRQYIKEEQISDSEVVAQSSSWEEPWNRDSNLDTGQGAMCEMDARNCSEEFSSTFQDRIPRDLSPKPSTGNNKLYDCCYCSFKSYSKTTWREHCFEKHPGNDLFCCKVCRYQTNLKYLLNRHMYVHNGEKKFKCHLCSYKTAYSFNMKTHYHKHNITL